MTLIEMVIVIAITAIIASAVAVFISRPVEGYADAARRAEMTDIADTALRRMTRDLRTALSNSIRTTTVSGVFAGGESIVIYNLASSGASANAYAGDNRAAVNVPATTATTIALAAATQFPFPSPGKRFQVVQYAVTYACNPAAGELRRYWNYGILAAQPTPPATGSNALLASNVAAVGGCSFTYVTSGTAQREGVVSLTLKIQESNESIQLFQQVHVTNVP